MSVNAAPRNANVATKSWTTSLINIRIDSCEQLMRTRVKELEENMEKRIRELEIRLKTATDSANISDMHGDMSTLGNFRASTEVDIDEALRTEQGLLEESGEQGVPQKSLPVTPSNHYPETKDEPLSAEQVHDDDGSHPVEQEVHFERAFAFEESVWDTAFFIGCHGISTGNSILLSWLLLVNILMQLAFCGVCLTTLVGNKFNDQLIEHAEAFRLNIAHDHMYVREQSLARRVCNQDASLEVAASQVELMRAAVRYVGDDSASQFTSFFQGPTMCLVAVFCWFLTVSQELGATFDLFHAVMQIPLNKGRRGRILRKSGDSFYLEHLGAWRSGIFFMVLMVRLTVAGILAYAGGLYLAYMQSASDLILNAVALQFVVDIDELVFAAAAPSAVRELMCRLEPMPLTPAVRLCGCDFYRAFVLVTTAVGAWAVLSTANADMVDTMIAYEEALCGGRKDFSYVLSAIGIPFLQSTSETQSRVNDHSWPAVRAVQEAIAKTASPEMELSFNVSLWATTNNVVGSMLTGEIASFINLDCQDEGWRDENGTIQNIASLYFANRSYNSCRDVTQEQCQAADLVGVFARAICPNQCGCSDPISPLAVKAPSAGCPASCRQTASYQDRLSKLPCSDEGVKYQDYWKSWADLIGTQPRFVQMKNLMLQLGCGVQEFVGGQTGPRVCEGTSAFGLGPFQAVCPLACGCTNFSTKAAFDLSSCPRSCWGISG